MEQKNRLIKIESQKQIHIQENVVNLFFKIYQLNLIWIEKIMCVFQHIVPEQLDFYMEKTVT